MRYTFVQPLAAAIYGVLFLLTCVSVPAQTVVVQNNLLRVQVTSSPPGVIIEDLRKHVLWRPSAPATGHSPLMDLKSEGPSSISWLQSDRGIKQSAMQVRLDLLPGKADLRFSVEMNPANDAGYNGGGLMFLPVPNIGSTVIYMAVADYCDGHLYQLTGESLPRTWFDGGRLDLPLVSICSGENGPNCAVILESSDDAFIECRRSPRENGTQIYAPLLGWQPVKGAFGPPRSVLLRFSPSGGYVAGALACRDWMREHGRLKTFTEKLETNPEIRRLFGAPDVWGDASLRFAKEARTAGVEKMLIHGRTTPEELRSIQALGYLGSEYDNYTDILEVGTGKGPDSNHDELPGAAAVQADGKRMEAWLTYDKKTQYMKRCPALWAKAAANVIPAVLKQYPYLGRFIDVTTAEGLYECYDPLHPLVKAQKREAGEDLLRTVRSNHLVVGGEHGIWWGVPYLDYIEGMMSGNRFAWPAGHLIHPKNQQEKFEGPYGTETWDVYRNWSMGHESRVPLWELVFHDCVVSTWYWGDSNDYLLDAAPDTLQKKMAFNVLYGTMPMLWADSGGAWIKQRDLFLSTVRNVCGVQALVAESAMIDHEFLTSDRALQRTQFANGTSCIVNFGEADKKYSFHGKTFMIPQNGWIVDGPGRLQTRIIENGKTVSRIQAPGFRYVETLAGSLAIHTIDATHSKIHVCGRTVKFTRADLPAGWGSSKVVLYKLNNTGQRDRAFLPGEQSIDFSGPQSAELVTGSALNQADLQVSEFHITGTAANSKRIARLRIRNYGANPVATTVSIYADHNRNDLRLGTTKVNLTAWQNVLLEIPIYTARLDGRHQLVAYAVPVRLERCTSNNVAIASAEFGDNPSRWRYTTNVEVPMGAIPRQNPMVIIAIENRAVDLNSVRISLAGKALPTQVCDPTGDQRSVITIVPGAYEANGSVRLIARYNMSNASNRMMPSSGCQWNELSSMYTGTHYSVHLDAGVLRNVSVNSNAAISQLMYSSATTGWTDEPGTVTRMRVLEDGPVRTVVYIQKRLQSDVTVHRTYTFYPAGVVETGSANRGYGVMSRAYFTLKGEYQDSGGVQALIDGTGDGEGVSGVSQKPRWYSVTGAKWWMACIALTPVSDITYWDAGSNWGGVGYNASPAQTVSMLYLFRGDAVPPSRLDAYRNGWLAPLKVSIP